MRQVPAGSGDTRGPGGGHTTYFLLTGWRNVVHGQRGKNSKSGRTGRAA